MQNHIGAGVRYNAQKSKVGKYFSTPIFAFRCKCHLCSGWFEIRTDPQNSRYVVTEGARQKQEDWDPEKEGGHAVFDTEAPKPSETEVDAFEALEKDTDQQAVVRLKRNRLDELEEASARQRADPYAVSRALRTKFRAEKKEALAKQVADGEIRERYGLADDIELGDAQVDKGSEWWAAARERRGLPVEEKKPEDLGKTIRKNTSRRYDVFDAEPVQRVRLKRKVVEDEAEVKVVRAKPAAPPPAPTAAVGLGGLAGYGSDSDSE